MPAPTIATGDRQQSTLAAALAAHDDRLSNCVHCGFCLPACPTYIRLSDEADSPRGRLHLMRAVAEGRLDPGADAFQTHIDRCLGCRACETVCPSGVEYGFLLERAREVALASGRSSVASRALLAMVRSPFLLTLSMSGGRVVRRLGLASLLAALTPDWSWLRTPRFGAAMLAASSDWRMASAGVPKRDGVDREGTEVDRESTESVLPPAPGRSSRRVGILDGCVQRHLFGRVNAATKRVLRANGWDVVEVPDQGCCGALHAHAGQLPRSRELALTNIRAFRAAKVDFVVTNAAGCGATMREYHHLLGDGDPGAREDAHWFAERVRDVSEMLAGEEVDLLRRGGSIPLRVAYDPPCHLLHGQRVTEPPLRLLRSIPGLEVVSVPKGEECCGGAGIYGITHPDLGGRIGEDKVDAVLVTGAQVLATGNPGCAMQIGAGLRLRGSAVRVAHPVELLDESYRRGGFYDGRD